MYTRTQSWVSMIREVTRLIAVLSCVALVFASFASTAAAATGVPRIMNYQGRLMNSSGTLLGGSGTDYCVKFSLYDNATVGSGSKLWPAGSPSTTTVTVRNGIFNAGVGDTNAGGDTLDFNFEDNDAVYLNVEVATKVGATCAFGDGGEVFETLSPRQRVTSSGYAINSATLGGKNGAYYLANSFSTTSATAYVTASSSLPKTYANNTFIGVNAFADITVVNSTTTSSIITNATSTNLNVAGTFSGAGLTSCSGSNDKLVWNATTRQFACDTDLSGGAGSDSNWTFFNNTGIRPATTSNQVLVGGTATTSFAKFEAQGGAKFDYATSTTFNTSILGLGGTEYFTSLAGTGLQNVGGVLTLNASGDWTGTFDGQEGSYYRDNSFSTTSAAHFASAGLAFSTTSSDFWLTTKSVSGFATSSADYWKTQNNFHSTTSFAYNLSTYSLGSFFSTTSVNYWDSTQFRWATTSSDAWLATKSTSDLSEGSNLYYTPNRVAGVIAGTTTDALAEGSTNKYFTVNNFANTLAATTTDALAEGSTNQYYTPARDIRFSTTSASYFSSLGLAFSTTSATYFNSVNPAASFSTTSADYWKTQTNFHSTTSFAYNLSTYSLGSFFSTTSVSYWESTQFRWATTSSDAWLATKSTTDLPEGTNLYYTPSRVAGVIAGTTTDALAEGVNNKYFTVNRFAEAFAATSTDALEEGITNLYYTPERDIRFSTTSASYFAAAGLAFSTTSAAYFNSVNPGASFSTTSADYWKTQNNFHSTSSFAYDLSTYDTGYFFSTTSVAYWDSTQFRWATTSSDAWLATKSTSDLSEGSNLYYTPNRVAGVIAGTTTDALAEGTNNAYFTTNRFATALAGTTTDALAEGVTNQYYTPARDIRFSTTSALYFSSFGLSFSTTSTDYYKSVNNFFSTTSASHFSSLGLAFSTTSAAYFLAQNGGGASFSTTSADYYVHSSTTIPKTYTDNTFAGTNNFQNTTATNATTTTSFTGTASSTNLFSNLATIGSLITGVFTGNVITATNATTTTLYTQYASTTNINANSATVGSATVGSLTLNTALTGGNGGTGLSTVTQNALLIGGAGNTWTQVSTSSLGLVQFSDLGAYLGLAAWYATTTDALAEGSTNTYFTTNRLATALAATTTDAIAEGSTNLYYTPARDIRFSTTSASYFAAAGLAFSTTSEDYYKSQNNFHSTTSFAYNLSTYSLGSFFSTTSVSYWDSTQFRWATTSSDAWLATKSTSNLTEGSNLYYTPNRVAGVIAGTTTDALAEGTNNAYFTTNRFATALAGTTTDALAEGVTNQYYTPARDIRFSTTSADFWKTQSNFFSTTSTDFWKTQNNFFSTTSASAFTSLGLAFSTTSTAYYLSQNQGAAFSTTSAIAFVHASTTIPKTYTANTFTALNTFDDVVAADATTTSLFARISSSVSAFFGSFSATSTTATSTISGALGIGITNPSYRVSVLGQTTGASSATGTAIFAISNDNNTLSSGNNVLRLNIRTPYGTACTSGTTCPRFEEYFAGVGSGSDTGGRGVGSLRLSTAGTGITQTSGAADFAEFMQLSESASVGDLVSLNAAGQYKKAVAGESIIGVVSDNAAFVGNGNLEGEPNAYIVGFAGVIRTTVSTANGPINAGDLIAASDVPGVGIKLSESGYALGQALESYSGGGNGTISVLVLPKFVDAAIALESYGGGASGASGYWDLSTSTHTVSLASTTNTLSIASTASTSNLVVSNGFTFGTASGVLKSVAGVVSSALVNLASDVTGVLGISNGGTGTSTVPAYGQILVGNAAGGYDLVATSTLGNSSGSAVWGAITGTLSAQTDLQNALDQKFSLSQWYATTTTALNEGTNLYYTPNRVAGVIAGTTTDALAEGSTNQYYTPARDIRFSTTSASFFTANGLSFSTTSTDYYKSQNNFHSTTSFAYNLSTYSLGSFFSTTSVAYWDSTQFRWATTSSDAWLATKSTTDLPEGTNLYYTPSRVAGVIAGTTTDALAEGVTNQYYTPARDIRYSTTSALYFSSLGLSFSTTSTDYYKSVNNFFSTTSASHFSSLGLAFSTTSAAYFTSQNQGASFSTTSADYYAHSSTTIPKTYSSNTFTGTNSFQNITATGATTTSLSTTNASTSNLWISNVRNGLVSVNAQGSVSTTTITGPLSYSANVLSISQANGAGTDGYLSSIDWSAFNNRLSTSTLALVDKGFFFSTTSTDYWLTTKSLGGFSTTSADFWKTQTSFFSTTSTDFWKTQNNFFSTTSASAFTSMGLAFSTTSTAYFLGQNQGAAFSTTSATAFVHASTTIPKTYTNNTFTGTNTFGNITATAATTTSFSATTASTSALYTNTATIGSATIGALSTVGTTTGTNGFDITNGCFSINGVCLTSSEGGGGGSGVLIAIQTFTAVGTTTYTPSAGATSAEVIVTGGGGGGGGADSDGATVEVPAGGAGAGATAILRVDLTSTTSVQVVVGAGGTGGTAAAGGTGVGGGHSSFGPTLGLAGGGNGGVGAVSADTVAAPRTLAGGTGGTATVGTVQISGGNGQDGNAQAGNTAFGGTGGSSYWGGGGDGGSVVVTATQSAGANATAYGAGGGGAALADTATGAAGGNGASGIVIVYEYGPFNGIMQIANGGTGTSTAPNFGQLLIGDGLGGYTLTSTSSLGLATTTDSLNEGTTNKYYTDTRVNTYVGASSTIAKTFTANVFTALQTFANAIFSNATSTNFAATGVASSTNLVASNSFTFGKFSGILKATAGSVVAALVDLTSDITGVLGISNGGTGTSTAPTLGEMLIGDGLGGYDLVATSTLGIYVGDLVGTVDESQGGTGNTTYVAGDILYAQNSGTLVRLPAGGNGTVLKIAGGLPAWGTDLQGGGGGGGGGGGFFSTTTDELAIFPSDPTYAVIVGNSATTTDDAQLEVFGKSYFSNRLGIATSSAGSIFSIGGVANFSTLGSTMYTKLNLVDVEATGASSFATVVAATLAAANVGGNSLSAGTTATTTIQGDATGTSTIQGFINVTGTNSTSTFSGGLQALSIRLTATSTAAGFNMTSGCYAINGVCTVQSLTATNTSLTVSPSTGAVGISLNLANPNLWTGLQQFGNATTSLLEATQFYARTIQSTSSNALILKSNLSSTAGLTFGSTSTPQVLGIDTINNRVTLGTGGGTPSLLVLDNKNTAGDPTGLAGAQYYNASTNEFRCFVTSWMTCGGQAASSTGNVQYRNIDGSFTANANFNWLISANTLVLTGASSTQTTDLLAIASSSGRTMFGVDGMGVITLSSTTDPVTPSSGELNIYAKDVAGRMLPKWIGPAGVDTSFQAGFFSNMIAMLGPSTGAAVTSFGMLTTTVGTISTPALATTNLHTSMRQSRVTSAAGANSASEIRNASGMVWRGNAAGMGGWFYSTRFAVNTTVANQRLIMGLMASTTAIAVTQPPVNSQDIIAVGWDSADTNLQIYYNDSGGAATKVDLGASYPANNTTAVYEFTMFAAPNSSQITARVQRLDTNISTTTVLTTNLPTATTFLTAHAYMNNGGTAQAVAFDLMRIYVESDN